MKIVNKSFSSIGSILLLDVIIDIVFLIKSIYCSFSFTIFLLVSSSNFFAKQLPTDVQITNFKNEQTWEL